MKLHEKTLAFKCPYIGFLQPGAAAAYYGINSDLVGRNGRKRRE